MFIKELIGEAAVYEQLAEEAAELAQAASKCARILRNENPTPVTWTEAHANLIEEYTDVKVFGIIINEEGKLMGLPQNRAVVIHDKVADILCGPAFICGLGEDGEFTDLTEAQISRLMPRITMLAIQC